MLGILYLLTRLNPIRTFSVSKYNVFKLTNQVALPPHPQENLTKVFQNANWLWGSLSLENERSTKYHMVSFLLVLLKVLFGMQLL